MSSSNNSDASKPATGSKPAPQTSELTIDQRSRRAFLKLLARDAERFHFRVLHDKHKGFKPSNLHGHIRDLEDYFTHLNTSGAGIFVVVNQGGHRDDDITRVRAVFADTDGAPLEPIVEALKPQFVVETSPGKHHVYWLVDDQFPLNQFKPVQQAIAARFGTDPSVCNLSRVMRVPGFMHNKSEPFPVCFVSLSHKLPPYGLDDIVNGLGLSLAPKVTSAPTAAHGLSRTNSLIATPSNLPSLTDVREMLRHIDPWSYREQWIKVLHILSLEYGEAARSLAVEWSRGDLWEGANNEP